jgi:hypothetical protein
MKTDPIALTHRQFRPYCEQRKPQRVAARQAMHGPIVPLVSTPRIPWAKLITGAVWVVCCAYAVTLWVTP